MDCSRRELIVDVMTQIAIEIVILLALCIVGQNSVIGQWAGCTGTALGGEVLL